MCAARRYLSVPAARQMTGRNSVTETRLLTNRRTVLKGAAGIGAMTLASRFPTPAIAQNAPLKVGLLLPYSGTYAQLGEAITRAMELYVNQDAGSLGGREITFA